ncbi:MAG: flexitail domain-containing putative surface protein [Dehalococcoidia bacterium]
MFKDRLTFPACIDKVMAVGAVYDASGVPGAHPGYCTEIQATAPDLTTCFSQSSDDLDLLAPGSVVASTFPCYVDAACIRSVSGTSFASPQAAGVAALMLDADPDLNPRAPGLNAAEVDRRVNEIEKRLEFSGKLVTDQFNDTNANSYRTRPRVDARVALLTQGSADFDQDGCTNFREFRDADGSQTGGGIRNPLDFWDFMDQYTGLPLARDRIVAVSDIGAVVTRFGTVGNPNGDPLVPPLSSGGYHTSADRNGAYPGANSWDLQPPDGTIAIGDLGAVIAQFGHSCA